METFDNIEDFFKAEAKARKVADAHVTPDQEALKPGDFCVRYPYGFPIYSEILDSAAMLLNGRSLDDLDEDERAEYDDEVETRNDPHMANYRFTRSYSKMCTYGELGDIHICEAEKISEREFELAKSRGWTSHKI
jgi:hypothetical protein